MKNNVTHMRAVITAGITISAVVVAMLPAVSAFADLRTDIRGVLQGAPVSTSPVPNTPATPTTPPAGAPPSGGITSSTEGNVNSGGNSGGTVTTGDQSVDVHETNTGPVNDPPAGGPPPSGVTTPPPATAPVCDVRSGSGCTVRDTRTR